MPSSIGNSDTKILKPAADRPVCCLWRSRVIAGFLTLSFVVGGCNSNAVTSSKERQPGASVQSLPLADQQADQVLEEMRAAKPPREKLAWRYVDALSRSSEEKVRVRAESIAEFADDPSVACALITNLDKSNHAQARVALFMLCELSEKLPLPHSCVPTALALLQHGRQEVRIGLITSLEETAKKTNIDPIKKSFIAELSKDPDEQVRKELAFSLGRLGDDPGNNQVYDELCRSLDSDKDERVQAAVIAALSSSSSFKAKHGREIMQMVEKRISSPSKAVRKEALEATSRFGKQSGELVPILIGVLNRPDEKIGVGSAHAFAARSLGAMGLMALPSLPQLRKVIHEQGVTNEVLIALGKMGPAAAPAVPDIVSFLQDKNAITASFALSTLGSIGPMASAALPELKQMLDTPYKFDKVRLRQTINQIEAPHSVSPDKKEH